jgi:Protein of unknown function (DUF1573).
MKKFVYLVIACAFFSIANAQESKDSVIIGQRILSQNDTFTFDKKEHDFGNISESGGEVECVFIFTNTGDSPLTITQVTASCGCTAPSWTKEPVAPGKQGYINAKFNPKGRSGNFSKVLAVYSNGSPKRMSLKIKGKIE